MKHLLGLILLLTSFVQSSVCIAQKTNVDSILNAVNSKETENQQLEILDKAYALFVANYDVDATRLIDMRIDKLISMRGLSDAVPFGRETAHYYMDRLRLAKADSILSLFLDKVSDIKDPESKFILYVTKADLEADSKRFDKAVAFYKLALEHSSQTQNYQIYAATFRNYGKSLVAIGEFGQASIALNNSLKIAKEHSDSVNIQNTLREQAILFSQLGLYHTAEEYILESQKYIYPVFPLSNAIDEVNLARNLILQSRYDEALSRYHRCISYGPFTGNYEILPLYAWNGIIEAHYFLNNTDSVDVYFHKLETLYNQINRNVSFEFLYLQARWLYRMSKNQFKLAEADGLKLFTDAQAKDDDAEILMYTKFFAVLYEKWGKFDSAYKYSTIYNTLKDSIGTANKTQALLLYQTQFETTEKENTILTLQNENVAKEAQVRSTRMRFIVGIIALALVAGFFIMRQYYRNKVERALQIEKLRTKISSDLHDDVGSILAGLSMQSEIMEMRVAEEHKHNLAKLSTMSRSAMSQMRDAVWTMDARNDNWGSLLDRMHEFAQESLGPVDIHYNLKSSGIENEQNLLSLARQNLYLIFKETVTNILKHSKGTEVQIELSKSKKGIQLKIQDNGVVKNKEHIAGQGLANIRMRALQLNGTAVFTTSNGFCVDVHI